MQTAMAVIIRRLSAQTLVASISLGILFGLNTAFAATLPPAQILVSACGNHDPLACILNKPTPAPGGEASYQSSGSGVFPVARPYSWSESNLVNATLGPGIPQVGAIHAAGHASASGPEPQSAGEVVPAGSEAGATIFYWFSVDQIKVPTLTPLVIPVYFEAHGEASVQGYGGYGVDAALLTGPTPVVYSIGKAAGPGSSSDSFSQSTTVDLSAGIAYQIIISASGSASASTGGTSFYPPGHSEFVVAVDPTVGFDQAAFDARYGSDSFPLAQYYAINFSPNVQSVVPLPTALPLFVTGLGALGLLGWRRKKKAAALAA